MTQQPWYAIVTIRYRVPRRIYSAPLVDIRDIGSFKYQRWAQIRAWWSSLLVAMEVRRRGLTDVSVTWTVEFDGAPAQASQRTG